jgi:DNA-binding transcriptional MerR regulator
MEYDIAALASVSGLSIDTIRYYQTLGLVAPPVRRGRHAVYDERHRARLARIRALSERGFSLKSLRELLDREPEAESDAVLRAALERGQAEATYTRREFAEAVGLSQTLLRTVERTGIVEPRTDEGGAVRYTESDMSAARGALKLLGRGLPLRKLLELAVAHHRATTRTVDRAIDLFDDYVRKRASERGDAADDGSGRTAAAPARAERTGAPAAVSDGRDAEAVAEVYRELMPVVTGLVAHHFQRVLVNRALARLKRSGERRSWRQALKATARAGLRLKWR